MNKEDALKHIMATPKPYLYIGMHQATFSAAVLAIKAGKYKEKSEKEFFAKFGITLTVSKNYELTEFNPLKK